MTSSLSLSQVPSNEELAMALGRKRSTRDTQLVSLVARLDIVAYNPETRYLQVWSRKNNRNRVILNHRIELRDKQHFFDLVQLIGKVAQLLAVSEEYRIPSPWWAYRFIV